MGRICVYLPEYSNPAGGRPRARFPESKFRETARDLVTHFGAGTWRRGCVGIWIDRDGTAYVDRIRILMFDTYHARRDLRWVKAYAHSVLLSRFDQKAIYVTLAKIEPVVVR